MEPKYTEGKRPKSAANLARSSPVPQANYEEDYRQLGTCV